LIILGEEPKLEVYICFLFRGQDIPPAVSLCYLLFLNIGRWLNATTLNATLGPRPTPMMQPLVKRSTNSGLGICQDSTKERSLSNCSSWQCSFTCHFCVIL
jgi:hypothetical protein